MEQIIKMLRSLRVLAELARPESQIEVGLRVLTSGEACWCVTSTSSGDNSYTASYDTYEKAVKIYKGMCEAKLKDLQDAVNEMSVAMINALNLGDSVLEKNPKAALPEPEVVIIT